MIESIGFIIPVYNTNTSLLSECISSLLKVTNVRKQIILVDDGSVNSDTLALLSDYDKNYEEVELITVKNGGPGWARNFGLERVSADYVCFVDSDDCIDPEEFSSCIEIMRAQNDNIDVVVAMADDNKMNPELFAGDEKDFIYCRTFGDASGKYKISNVWVLWAKLYRLDIVKEKRFDSNLKYGEDTIFLGSLKYEKIMVVNKSIYRHIKNEDSLCNKYNPNADKDFAKTILAMEREKLWGVPRTAVFHFYLNQVLTLQVFNKKNELPFREKRKMARRILSEEPFNRMFEAEKTDKKVRRQRLLMWLLEHHFYYIAFLLQNK